MYISTKAKWIIISLGSTLACAGAAASGWAVMSYYEENTKTPSEHLTAANEMKIAPNVSKKMSNYSSEWMSSYATDKDFDFKTIVGYEPSLKYEVVSKTPLGNNLEVEVQVTNSNLESLKYTTTLTNIFATPEISSTTVINQTITVLPKYGINVNASAVSTPGATVAPDSITINSSDFSEIKKGSYKYESNGALLESILTIDQRSAVEDVVKFIDKFKELGTNLTDEELNKEIELNISLGKTIILFQVNDGILLTNNSGTLMVKDFTDLDSSNFVENAEELEVVLSDKLSTPPTSQEIIESINNNNSQKYLIFKGLPSLPKFNYKISSATIEPDDIVQESLNIEVVVSQENTANTKIYTTKLTGLLSIQQNEINNMLENDLFTKWGIKPTIARSYQSKTIKQIIESKDFEAFLFRKTSYPDLEYSILFAQEIVLSGKSAISVEVQIKSISNPKATTTYMQTITKGFKPS